MTKSAAPVRKEEGKRPASPPKKKEATPKKPAVPIAKAKTSVSPPKKASQAAPKIPTAEKKIEKGRSVSKSPEKQPAKTIPLKKGVTQVKAGVTTT